MEILVKRCISSFWRTAMRKLLAGLTFVALCTPVYGQLTFKGVEVRNSYGLAEGGTKGQLVVDADKISFFKKKRYVLFSIPSSAVNEIFYSRVSGRRLKTAVATAIFTMGVGGLLALSKGRKHYMSLSFNDEENVVGAVEFKLHKSNYRSALRTVEQVTGLTMLYDQEGIKDTKQTVARRGDNAPRDDQGSLKISSDPEGAEIEIDGAFVGNTPRTRAVQPGEHTVKLRHKGYTDWERNVAVEVGETLHVVADLKSKNRNRTGSAP